MRLCYVTTLPCDKRAFDEEKQANKDPVRLPRQHLPLRQFLLVEGLIHSVQKPLYTTFTPRGASLTDEVRDQTWCNRHSADVKTLLMQIPVML
jgi:hypothetical protein